MITKMRLKNLRSLVDTGEIELKPLTLLVGKNSSGKSTFLRFFPLMKQTLETSTNEPILWYSSSDVDFGSFSEAINRKGANSISFDFESTILKNTFSEFIPARFMYRYKSMVYVRRAGYDYQDSQSEFKIKISIEFQEKFIEHIVINFEDYILKLSFKSRESLSEFCINNKQFNVNEFNVDYRSDTSNILPRIIYKSTEKKSQFVNSIQSPTEEYFAERLAKCFKEIAHSKTKEETLVTIIDGIELDSSKNVILNLINSSQDLKIFHEHLINLQEDSEAYKGILINVFGIHVNRMLSFCNAYLKDNFLNVKYIAPIRARAERYYRNQGLSLLELDPQGENIPMILHNMPNSEKRAFNNWTSRNFNFEIVSKTEAGHTSLRLKYGRGMGEINLADTGFGYSQILPIILLLWRSLSSRKVRRYNHRPTTLVIEQPELHLHPALQAKLMDTFIQLILMSNKKNIPVRIIVETHSETMINRIGQLFAQKTEMLSPEMVNILIFDQDNSYQSTIKSTTFSNKGHLLSWPIGFFYPEED